MAQAYPVWLPTGGSLGAADAQGVTRGDGVTDQWQLVMLPFCFGNGGGGTVWYDDVYIATSLAPVP